MRAVVLYLLYAAVVLRAIAYNFYDDPVSPIAYALLLAYGVLLVSEPALSRRFPHFPFVYLCLQSAFVTAMLVSESGMDFLPSLYFPLSYQAVLAFGRQVGFRWIAVFVLMFSLPLLYGWEWQIQGWATVILNAAGCLMVGSYAHLTQRSEKEHIANKKLYGEVQEAYRQLQDQSAQIEEYAILQERSRMARELHDSVTQTIFSMNLTVQSARMLLSKDISQVAAQLNRLQELAGSAIAELQVLVNQLGPGPLIENNLAASLQNLALERTQRDGLHIDLQVTGERRLPQAVTVGLFRITQEALNNIVKHAAAGNVCMRLDLDGSPASLEVEDDGCGFDPDAIARDIQHIGLAGMAERARELGWKLDIASQPGRGTRLRVEEALA
jgi:signal transduction histidine kinase